MKRILIVFFTATTTCNYTFAQSIALKQKSCYNCKIRGFVKYYHSEAFTFHVHCDSILNVDIVNAKPNSGTALCNQISETTNTIQ